MQMKSYKMPVILIILILIGAFSLIAQRRTGGRKEDKYFRAEHSKNIEEDVRQAKQKGLSEIYLPSPKITWAGAENIDSVIATDAVVFAKLTGKESAFYDNDKTVIVTWLRFDVIDHIAGPPIPNLPPPAAAPQNLTKNFQPSASFLVRVLGGTLYQDEVKIIGDGPFAELPVNQNFVLFVYFDSDSQQALGGFNYGPQSVVPVDELGAIPSYAEDSPYVIKQFIAETHAGNLDSLKSALKNRAEAHPH